MEATVASPFLDIAIAHLQPSATNPRKHFDQVALEELAASFGTKGILQPILVRTLANGAYEIVAGERRYRAAKLAKLESIPAIVRELTDAQVLEVQVIENLQRKDLTALEEARGYQSLLELRPDLDVEALAERIGKSKGYVYGRLKLVDLIPSAAASLEAGKIEASVALLLARIARPEHQEKALKVALEGEFENDLPATHEELREWIADHVQRRLKMAPFDKKSPTLDAEAGPCTACPKNSGVEPSLFTGAKSEDMCLDPVCFDHKVDLAWEQKTSKAAADGKKVLSATKSAKLYQYGNLKATHVLLTSTSPTGKKTWAEALKGVEVEVQVARDPDGKPVEVITRKAALEAAAAAGLAWAKAAQTLAAKHDYKAEAEERRREYERKDRQREVRIQVANDVVLKMEEAAAKRDVDAGFLRLVLDVLTDAIQGNPKSYFERYGLKVGKEVPANLKAPQLRAAIAGAIALSNPAPYGDKTLSAEFQAVAALYRVDWKKPFDAAMKEFADQEKELAKKESSKEPAAKKEPKKRKAAKVVEAEVVSGVCKKCGCIDSNPCLDAETGLTCSWMDDTETLCSSCAGDLEVED